LSLRSIAAVEQAREEEVLDEAILRDLKRYRCGE